MRFAGLFLHKQTARDQWCHIEHLCVLTFGFGLVKCTKLLYLDYGLLSGLDRLIGVQPAKITKKLVTPDMQILCQRRVWGTCTLYPNTPEVGYLIFFIFGCLVKGGYRY